MLTLTLRMLERNGLATRHVHAEVPPRVEYALSPLGHSMLRPLQAFAGWIDGNPPAMEEARSRYAAAADDARAGRGR